MSCFAAVICSEPRDLVAPDDPSQHPGGETRAADGARLDSWKAIAAFFGRDVRTVQRWERSEGLPVHRHPHEKAGTVHAYAAELDEWRKNRTRPLPNPAAGAEISKSRRLVIAVAASVLILAGSVAFIPLAGHNSRAAAAPRPIPGRLFANATRETGAIHWIPVGKRPLIAIASADRSRIFVANELSGTVSVIDAWGDTKLADIQTGGEPHSLVTSADGRYLYAGNHAGYVSEIDLAHGNEMRSIRSSGSVFDIALAPRSRRVYLAIGTGGLQEASFAENTIRAIQVAAAPMFLAFSAPGGLYINYQGGGPGGRPGHDVIEALDAASGRVENVLSGPPNVGGPLALSPDGNQIWANGEDACWSPAYDHDGCPLSPGGVINVIRVSDNRVARTLGLPAAGAGEISFFPDGSRAVVSGSVETRVIDTRRFSAVEALALKQTGKAVFARGGTRAYIPVQDRNALAVFDLSADRCAPQPSGLIGWWPGDGSGGDVLSLNAGYSHEANDFAPGFAGQAFRLHKDRDVLTFAPPASGASAEQMTAAAWVKLEGPHAQFDLIHLLDLKQPGSKGWRVIQDQANPMRLCRIETIDEPGCATVGAAGRTAIAGNRWTHIAISRNAERIQLFVNGELEAEMPASNLPGADSVSLRFHLNGWVDEIQWFNRALDSAELKSMVNAGSAGLCYATIPAAPMPAVTMVRPASAVSARHPSARLP